MAFPEVSGGGCSAPCALGDDCGTSPDCAVNKQLVDNLLAVVSWPKFLASKYYPVDPTNKLIYLDPHDMGTAVLDNPKYKHTCTYWKGSKLNEAVGLRQCKIVTLDVEAV